MEAFRQKQTVPTQCRRGPLGTSSALRGRRERREKRYARMTAGSRAGIWRSPRGARQPCAHACITMRPAAPRGAALRGRCKQRQAATPYGAAANAKEKATPAALVAEGEVGKVVPRLRGVPAMAPGSNGERPQRPREPRQPRRRRDDGDSASRLSLSLSLSRRTMS